MNCKRKLLTKRIRFSRVLPALCALLLLLEMVPAAQAAATPAVSNNKNDNGYSGNYGTTVKSYLYQNPSGGLTRVEYLGDNKIIAEDYSSSFQIQSSRTIPFELSIWGGFFAGETYNFFIFGQKNPNDSDSVETIRVVKYDKNWNRLGQYSLYGGNIYIPFDAGSLRCAEYGGYLYIHSCREMYKDSKGLHHQANMTLQIRESDMAKIQYLDRGLRAQGYVSHSFNQFIMVDSDRNVVVLDHGDGHPRAIVLIRFSTKAGSEPLDGISGYWGDGVGGDWSWHDVENYSHIFEFPGKIGQNLTGATVGGLAETSSGYVSAFSHDDAGSGFATRKIYLGYTSKNGLNSSLKQVSSVPSRSVPQLAPTGLNGGYILWDETDGFYTPKETLYYAAYTADGSVGAVQTAKGYLSDCAPIYYNGKSVWYTTDDSAPVFYTLDASGVTAIPANGGASSSLPTSGTQFRDVSASHWAKDTIADCAAQGIVSGVGGGNFDPEGQVTSIQFITMLTRAFYADELSKYTAAPGQPWYTPNINLANDVGITKDLSVSDAPMTRYDMALALLHTIYAVEPDTTLLVAATMHIVDPSYNHMEEYAAAKTALSDYNSIPAGYQHAVSECYSLRILSGMSDGAFHGEQTMTRAQACAAISRIMTVVNDFKLPS